MSAALSTTGRLVCEPRSNALVVVARACKHYGGRRFAFAVASLRRTPLPPFWLRLLVCWSLMAMQDMLKMRTRTKWLLVCFFVLYGTELLLALLLSATWVKDASQLLAFAVQIERFAPVVGNFDQVARYPEGLRVFLAITICLLPLKVCLSYFAMNMIPAEDPSKPLKDRTFGMLLTLLIVGIPLIGSLTFGSNRDDLGRGLLAIYYGITAGGFFLWVTWSFIVLGINSIAIVAAIRVVNEWCTSLFKTERNRK